MTGLGDRLAEVCYWATTVSQVRNDLEPTTRPAPEKLPIEVHNERSPMDEPP